MVWDFFGWSVLVWNVLGKGGGAESDDKKGGEFHFLEEGIVDFGRLGKSALRNVKLVTLDVTRNFFGKPLRGLSLSDLRANGGCGSGVLAMDKSAFVSLTGAGLGAAADHDEMGAGGQFRSALPAWKTLPLVESNKKMKAGVW